MNKAVFYLLEFVLAFLIVYTVYRFVIIRKKRKNKKNKDNKKNNKKLIISGDNKTPIELSLFLNLNKIDEKSVDKEKVMRGLCFINALDIATILLFTELSDNLIVKLFIAFISVFVLMILSYKLYGLKFKKEVMKK